MTRDDVKKIVMTISTAYPNWKPDNMTKTVDLWAVIFGGYPTEVIEKATMEYITTDTKGYAPSPGQIINCIDTGKKYLNEEEAWDLVYKGICRSGYNSEEEFEKLPDECKRAIGSPENMKELAMMDITTVLTVEKSHFMRVYRLENEKTIKTDKTVDGLLTIREKVDRQIEVKRQDAIENADKTPEPARETTTDEQVEKIMSDLKALLNRAGSL